MLINLFILSSCTKTNDFCVLKSIKSNRQSNFTVAYKACKKNDNFIDLDDFNNYIASTLDHRINSTIFGFNRKFPLKIDLSNTNIKYFDIRGGEKNQFVYFIGTKNGITIQGTRVNILFEETKISLKSAILSRSIIYSPNGKIDLFAKNLITDGFSLKNNFFSNLSCYQYKLTSRIKPTVKVHILYDKNNIHSESSNDSFLFNNEDNFSQKSDINSKNRKEPDFKKYNKHYYHLVNSTNLHTKDYNYTENKHQLLESKESFQRHFPFDSDFIEFPRYIKNLIDIKDDQFTTEIQNDEKKLNTTEVKYCLCMKNRLNRCKESVECDSYFIPLENYVTGKEDWFKNDISHSANRTIKLYITATEGSIMNIGFEDFLGKNNTIYFILANLESPAFVSIGGKYMSSSTSQLGVFSAIFNNINQVSINSDIVSKLKDVTLKQSPLIIRPSHHLTIHRLITDTRSIASFEGTLYISEFLVLNNSIPLLLEGTLFLDEGCIVYVPQISLFPNVFINDEYILFSDEDQDNDLVLYFTEVTDNSKKWTFYMLNEILIEDGHTYPSVNFYLKTNSESVIPILFVFDIQYQGISLIYDDISKLPSTINFEVVTSENDKEKGHFLEIQIDYTDPPKNILFKKISGNIDLVLLTSKTIQYFLDNKNPPSCFDQTGSTGESCDGIDLYGLNSLTFYVYFSMTKITFKDDSIMIYFGSDMISFTSSLTNTIQVIADLQSELQMSIAPGSAKLFPLSLIVINNNSVINFDDSFSYIVDSNDPDVKGIANCIYILHDNMNIDLVSSDISYIPSVIVDNQLKGVLYNTSTETTYDVSKSTNFSENSFRSGPKVTVNIVDDGVIVPQSSFLANEVMFCGKPFIFSLSCKSRCIYIFDNDVKINVLNNNANETVMTFSSGKQKIVQKTDIVNFGGFYSNISDSAQSNINFIHNSDIDFSNSNSGYKASLIDHLSFNSNALLEEKVEEVLNKVNVHGLVFTKSGKISQNNDQISSPNIKIKLSADLIECQTVSSINESNFDGAINIFNDFQLNDSTINIIELSIDSVRVSDTNHSSALLYQALKSATFEVFYEGDEYNNNLNILNANNENKVITMKTLNKETQILKNFTLYVDSPATIFFDSSWYNVTNPEDLVIVTTKDIKLQTELLKMPNFTVKLLDSAHKTIVIKKPKHTSKIAFYTFLTLAIAVFIVCFVFCIIDFCCILKPKSVEIDLGSSSSDHSLDNFPFTTSSSSLYEYYSDDEMQNKELENIEVAKPNIDDNNNNAGKSGISITAYGNTTAEWRAEHLKKRRKRPKEEEEEDLNDKKRKKKKNNRKNKKKKQVETELNAENESLPLEEMYYEDDNNNN